MTRWKKYGVGSEEELDRWREERYQRKIVEGRGPTMKVTPRLSSKASRKANSQRVKEVWKDEEFRKRMIRTYNSPESLARRAEATRRAWKDKKSRKRRIASIQASRAQSVETRRTNYPNGIPQLKEAQKRRWSSEAVRRCQSIALKKAWSDPIKGKRLRRGLLKSGPRWRRGMTRPEKQVFDLLRRLGYSYRWTGGGKGRVLRYVPDFMHTRFKKIIEYYGEHWHTSKGPKGRQDRRRIKEIKNEGFSVLVIRQKDLLNLSKLIGKIKTFHLPTRR